MNKTLGLVAAAALLFAVSGCASPQATVAGCPAAPEVSFTEDVAVIDGDMMDAVAMETERFGKELIGMAESEAVQCVDDAGLTWRVYEQDGEQFALTMDYRAERVNVKIENGIVADAYAG